MKIWKNTSTLDDFDKGLNFIEKKNEADIVLMGSKGVELSEFPKLKGIFRAGIGRDNVPEKEAQEKGIIVRFPSKETIDIIYDETARFTCGLIFRMLYSNVGTLEPWIKKPRRQLKRQILLVIGNGQIGGRVAQLMEPFLNVVTYDVLENKDNELKQMIQQADCVSLHIPMSDENISFFDAEKLSWIKSEAVLINTARGAIVDEKALSNELKNGRLKAAFDVYWQEPYLGKLKEFYPDRFYMTPHVASTCIEFLESCRKDLDNFISNLS